MCVEQLPPELVTCIYQYLELPDLISACAVNRNFRSLVLGSGSLWKHTLKQHRYPISLDELCQQQTEGRCSDITHHLEEVGFEQILDYQKYIPDPSTNWLHWALFNQRVRQLGFDELGWPSQYNNNSVHVACIQWKQHWTSVSGKEMIVPYEPRLTLSSRFCQAFTKVFQAGWLKRETKEDRLHSLEEEWKKLLVVNKHSLKNNKRVSWLCRHHVPSKLRLQIWKGLLEDEMREMEFTFSYPSSETLLLAAENCEELRLSFHGIRLDVMRTFETNLFLSTEEDRQKLADVLRRVAYSVPEIGYRSGMHCMAAMFLVVGFTVKEAYLAMLCLLKSRRFGFEKAISSNFTEPLVFDSLVAARLPELYRHMCQVLRLPTVVYSYSPLTTGFAFKATGVFAFRVFDCLLSHSYPVLYAILLQVLSNPMLLQTDITRFLNLLNCTHSMTENQSNRVLKDAFKNFHTFWSSNSTDSA